MAIDDASLQIRAVTPDDFEILVPILEVMEHHYEGTAAISLDLMRKRTKAALSHIGTNVIRLIALEELEDTHQRALGFATAFSLFPAKDLEVVWFLKELFVTEATRGRGVGEALLRHLATEVLARGGDRFDFTTDVDNAGAQKFYARVGVQQYAKVYFRAEGDDLIALAGGRL